MYASLIACMHLCTSLDFGRFMMFISLRVCFISIVYTQVLKVNLARRNLGQNENFKLKSQSASRNSSNIQNVMQFRQKGIDSHLQWVSSKWSTAIKIMLNASLTCQTRKIKDIRMIKMITLPQYVIQNPDVSIAFTRIIYVFSRKLYRYL